MPTRTPSHARSPKLEHEILELNALLRPTELAAIGNFQLPEKPTVFIVGGARSGSTVAFQALAATGVFGYPSNFISRFPAAPFLMARIQRLYSEMDAHGEFPELSGAMNFSSILGKTRGMLGPHEFWYFWRTYFRFPDVMSERTEEVGLVNADVMLRELAAIESIFDLPLLFKGSIFSWNIPLVANLLPKALFLHVTRDPVTQGASLLKARREFFADESHWYSWKTPDYQWLKEFTPVEQVVGQAMSVDASTIRGAGQIETGRYLIAPYEEFCADPKAWLSFVGAWLSEAGVVVPDDFHDVSVDTQRRSSELPCRDRIMLEEARDFFHAKYAAIL